MASSFDMARVGRWQKKSSLSGPIAHVESLTLSNLPRREVSEHSLTESLTVHVLFLGTEWAPQEPVLSSTRIYLLALLFGEQWRAEFSSRAWGTLSMLIHKRTAAEAPR